MPPMPQQPMQMASGGLVPGYNEGGVADARQKLMEIIMDPSQPPEVVAGAKARLAAMPPGGATPGSDFAGAGGAAMSPGQEGIREGILDAAHLINPFRPPARKRGETAPAEMAPTGGSYAGPPRPGPTTSNQLPPGLQQFSPQQQGIGAARGIVEPPRPDHIAGPAPQDPYQERPPAPPEYEAMPDRGEAMSAWMAANPDPFAAQAESVVAEMASRHGPQWDDTARMAMASGLFGARTVGEGLSQGFQNALPYVQRGREADSRAYGQSLRDRLSGLEAQSANRSRRLSEADRSVGNTISDVRSANESTRRAYQDSVSSEESGYKRFMDEGTVRRAERGLAIQEKQLTLGQERAVRDERRDDLDRARLIYTTTKNAEEQDQGLRQAAIKMAQKKMETGWHRGSGKDAEADWQKQFRIEVQFFMNEIRGGGVELSIDD